MRSPASAVFMTKFDSDPAPAHPHEREALMPDSYVDRQKGDFITDDAHKDSHGRKVLLLLGMQPKYLCDQPPEDLLWINRAVSGKSSPWTGIVPTPNL